MIAGWAVRDGFGVQGPDRLSAELSPDNRHRAPAATSICVCIAARDDNSDESLIVNRPRDARADVGRNAPTAPSVRVLFRRIRYGWVAALFVFVLCGPSCPARSQPQRPCISLEMAIQKFEARGYASHQTLTGDQAELAVALFNAMLPASNTEWTTVVIVDQKGGLGSILVGNEGRICALVPLSAKQYQVLKRRLFGTPI